MFESERLVFRAPEEAIDLEWMWKTGEARGHRLVTER